MPLACSATTSHPSTSVSWRSIWARSICPSRREPRRRRHAASRPCRRSRAVVADEWFAEPPFAGLQQRYRILERVHSQTTPWQTLEVLDLEGPGRALILGGTLQT